MRVLSSPTPLSTESGWDSAGEGSPTSQTERFGSLILPPMGLAQGRVNSLRFGPRGALWVATENGLSRIKNDHVTTLTSKNGIPCDTVQWSMDDTDHFVWVYTACGLVRIPRPELDAWVDDPSKLVQATLLRRLGRCAHPFLRFCCTGCNQGFGWQNLVRRLRRRQRDRSAPCTIQQGPTSRCTSNK
jgi:hypothetical protein